MNAFAKCPSCLAKVRFGPKPRIGKRFLCPECEAYVEIVKMNPPLLDWAFEQDKDYNDSFDYQYDPVSFENRF